MTKKYLAKNNKLFFGVVGIRVSCFATDMECVRHIPRLSAGQEIVD